MNWIGLSGLAESINTYLSLGKKHVEDHILTLVAMLYRGIEGLENIEPLPLISLHNRSNIVYLRATEINNIKMDEQAGDQFDLKFSARYFSLRMISILTSPVVITVLNMSAPVTSAA